MRCSLNLIAALTILVVAVAGGAVVEQGLLDRVRTTLLESGLAADDLTGMRIADLHRSDHNGVTHCYVQQTFRGIDIEGARTTVNFDPVGNALPVQSRFVPGLAGMSIASGPPCSALHALTLAAGHLGLPAPEDSTSVDPVDGPGSACVLRAEETSSEPVDAVQVYLPQAEGLFLVWKLTVHVPTGGQVWDVMVDARDDRIHRVIDRVSHASYRVYPTPLASPDEGAHELVVDPFDPVASPFGWHDTDGAPGAEYNTTRGNNAFVVEDQDDNDNGGTSPSGGSELLFDIPRAVGTPTDDESAAVNAFYWVNLCHDILYRFGFDEAAGNFQENNYGHGGGQPGDGVLVDIQDGGGRNNASMFTARDGRNPRMTFHLWDGALEVEILEPSSAADTLVAGPATFGATPGSGVRGRVVLALDARDEDGPTSTDLCSAILNADEVAGNIALIDRGTCFFTVKVLAAQKAGAMGVIVVNNAGDDILRMGGDESEIVIPAVFVGQSDGERLKSLLEEGLEVILTGDGSRDSAFANDIIIHEYGHGVSTRLTGGASTSGCLNQFQSEGMGEGWSDWLGLAFTAKPADSLQVARGIGKYVTLNPLAPEGIRNYPYSTDLEVSPLTYGDIASLDEEHDVGEVWCAALWDLYWNLVAVHGWSPDLVPGPAGNQIALQLVMDGLKLQPCNPSFLDGRNAILTADRLNNNGANQHLIWNAFAKRGMGVHAHDGGSAGAKDIMEDFTVPDSGQVPQLALRQGTEELTFTWNSVFDGKYLLQASDTLISPSWATVTPAIPSQGVVTSTTLPLPGPANRYFRVVLLP